MSKFYILNGHEPVRVPDVLTWARWFEESDRIVKQDELSAGGRVSTIFLGLDHNFMGDSPPRLFETMVFGGRHDGYMGRCATWDEAERMHARVLYMCRETNK